MKKDDCIFFIYKGCGGDLNNFISEEECEQECDVQRKKDELHRMYLIFWMPAKLSNKEGS